MVVIRLPAKSSFKVGFQGLGLGVRDISADPFRQDERAARNSTAPNTLIDSQILQWFGV